MSATHSLLRASTPNALPTRLALELLDLFAELRDLVILVDLRAAVSGEGVLARPPVLLRPPPERQVLDPELPRKVDGPHLAAEDHPRRRYLELLVATPPLLGHIEHLSPLIWCPRNLTLSR